MRIRHWRCWGWSSPASRHEGDGVGGDYEEHYGEDGDSGGDDGDVADDSGDGEVVIGNVAMFCDIIRMNLVNFNSLFFLVRPYNSPWSSNCMMVMLMIIDDACDDNVDSRLTSCTFPQPMDPHHTLSMWHLQLRVRQWQWQLQRQWQGPSPQLECVAPEGEIKGMLGGIFHFLGGLNLIAFIADWTLSLL